jgi:hypothetical protein
MHDRERFQPRALASRSIAATFLRVRSLAVAALIVLLSAAPARAQRASAGMSDSGLLQILAKGNRVGTERFQIRSTANGWEASGELQLDAPGTKMSEANTLRLDTALMPVSYRRDQKAPLAATLEVAFGGRAETTLTSNAGEEPLEQAFYLPENDLAVLDTNFFHHYALLLLHYDRAAGGPQPFNVFIPQEALPGTVTVTFVASEPAPGRPDIQFDHFRATSEEVEIDIWTTPQGALQRIAIPAAGLEVVRQ